MARRRFTVGSFGAYIVIILFSTLIIVGVAQVAPEWLTIVLGIIVGIGATVIFLWLFFFMAGKVAYAAGFAGRREARFLNLSAALFTARGNVRRLMAMTFFIVFATYSALMLLVIPLG